MPSRGSRRLGRVSDHIAPLGLVTAAAGGSRSPEATLHLAVRTEDDAWPHEAAKQRNGGFAVHCVSAWGVPIYATQGVPTATLSHAGHVLAQWLDNDEDGVPEMAVVEAMVANDALLFMAAEESENRTIIRSLREIGLEDAAQDIGAWETVPGWVGADGIPRPHAPDEVHGGFDASIEEILHCVTDQGYGRAFPELDGREEDITGSGAPTFGEGSNLLDLAMCASRGGLPGLPDEADYDAYPDGSWYHYGGRDKAEYIYWLVTTWLGCHADPARAAMIGNEWKLSTREQLLHGHGDCPPDALGVALLQDPRYRLPVWKLPDGHYQGPSGEY